MNQNVKLTANELLKKATQLAMLFFKDNLLLSFIGGSYAKGLGYEKKSDIDIFVVLNNPDRKTEVEFAIAFKEFHLNNELNFSHCGEIFDKNTLENLIDYTINFLEILPQIQNVGCYHGDCIFSIFRKGDIVLKFFDDPKQQITGDINYLKLFENKASKYFKDFPMNRVQLGKNKLLISNVKIKNYEKILLGKKFFDTPIGIGMERWFNKKMKYNFKEQQVQCSSNIKEIECPLMYYSINTIAGQLYRDQCLAISHIGE